MPAYTCFSSRCFLNIAAVVVALISFVTLPGTARAEEPDLSQTNVYDTGSPTISDIAVGDLNGDGFLDIVVIRENSRLHTVYFSDGAGNFDDPARSVAFGDDSMRKSYAELGDVNGDGWLDILVSGYGEAADTQAFPPTTVAYLNDGTGHFSIAHTLTRDSDRPLLGDLNGDGSLDIVGWKQTFLNDGAGNYRAGASLGDSGDSVGFRAYAVADINGDGLLDVIAQVGDESRLLLAQADGTFSEGSQFGRTGSDHRVFAVADIDGDGSQDVAAAFWDGPSQVYLELCLNRTQPPSLDCRTFDQGDLRTNHLAVADVDGNGWPDLIASGGGRPNRVYYNQGQPFGSDDPPRMARGQVFATGATKTLAGDMDGNGSLDLITLSLDGGLIHLNDGSGNAQSLIHLNDPLDTDSWQDSGVEVFGRAIAIADLNRDGRLDVVAGNSVLFTNSDGDRPRSVTFKTIQEPSAVAVADLDGANGPDLIFVQTTGGNWILWNDGSGGFARAQPLGEADGRESSSLAVGDLNSDGTLDIVVGSNGFVDNQLVAGYDIYFSDGAGHFAPEQIGGFPSPSIADEALVPQALALGDLDGDGSLDIVAGNSIGNRAQSNVIFYNDGAGHFGGDGRWQLLGSLRQFTRGVAVGDLNGDGLLDIAVGNGIGVGGRGIRQNYIYLNQGNRRFEEQPFGPGNDATSSVALGDVDGDGDLDIAVGNGSADASHSPAADERLGTFIYLNDGEGHFPAVRWAGRPTPSRTILTVVDSGQDGTLDVGLALTSTGTLPDGVDPRSALVARLDADTGLIVAGSRVFLRVAGEFREQNFDGLGIVTSVAVADFDGKDGTDLYFVRQGRPNQIYWNDGTNNFILDPKYLGNADDSADTAAIADFDGNGLPDIVEGVVGPNGLANFDPSFLWLSDGNRQFSYQPFRSQPDNVLGIALGDLDGNGTLDLVRSSADNESVVSDLVNSSAPSPARTAFYTAIAKFQQEFDLLCTSVYIAELCFDPYHYLTNTYAGAGGANTPPGLVITGPAEAVQGGLAGRIIEETVIPIAYSLADGESDSLRLLRGCYSLDGGDNWRMAVAEGATPPTPAEIVYPANGCPYAPGLESNGDRAASPDGTPHTFLWDTFASGFFGQSDRVVVRLEAYPAQTVSRGRGFATAQRPYASSSTQPFRVRGTQVRVFAQGIDATQPVTGALVYRLPAGQTSGGQFLGVSGPGGYVLGRGAVSQGDRLFALLPISQTWGYAFYHTSASPVADGIGLALATVDAPGVQSLTVSAGNPLLLFNLDISLEWDARNDGSFLTDLEAAIRRSSDLFYDVSNGQMALGQVRIFQNKERWLAADAVIYADNGIRPRATMGGMVTESTADVTTDGRAIPDAYLPGQIRMGPLWDPFGQSRAELTQDWWRALAHEFGHYLLYLPDNYLGYAEDGAITSADCQGSFMTSAYDDGYSEFLTRDQFQEAKRNCGRVLATRLTGRSDWETIRAFYPMVKDTPSLDGPAALPFLLTDIRQITPVAAATVLSARNFDLRDADSGKRLPVAQGQAWLFKRNGTADPIDDRVISLGNTGKADYIKVRGAAIDDELCVIDLSTDPALTGCQRVTPLGASLPIRQVTGWQPNVQVEAVFAPEMVITVTTPLDSPPVAWVHSFVGASPAVTVTPPSTGDQYYRLEVENPARVITFTRPLTAGVPYVTVLVRPALVVNVTLPVSTTETLYAQILPADSGTDAGLPSSAPWAALEVMDTDNQHFTQVFALDYPIFAGAVKIWSSAAQKVAVSQFYAPPVWRVDLRPGSGADIRGGSGTDIRGGSGVDIRGGSGTDIRGGSGTDIRPGSGVDIRGGSGVDIRPGTGVDIRPGSGVDIRPGSGVDLRPGSGVDIRPGSGVDIRGGSGADIRGGSGADIRGGSGADIRGGSGADIRGGSGTNFRAWGANRRALGAPIGSADGFVTLFNREDVFGDTFTASLETLPAAPQLPGWLTPVGQAYRFAEQSALERTIAFNYLQRDVPSGYEYTLKIYYSGDEGANWHPLSTRLDTASNLATAPANRSGLFVLVAVVDIPLTRVGWNLFAYPIPESRPVTEALASLGSSYTTVAGFERRDPLDPWKLYDPSIPAWARDLHEMNFGNSYWIWVSQPITLQLAVAGDATASALALLSDIGQSEDQRTPPALFYGTVTAPANQSIATDATVQARIGERVCGESRLLGGPDVWKYRVEVAGAVVGDTQGCGAAGALMLFWVGDQPAGLAEWDNRTPQMLDLTPEVRP